VGFDKQAWEPQIDRVVKYELSKQLPSNLGPVGPQIDAGVGRYLPGGGSQIEMTFPASERMDYLKILSEKPIK